MDRSRVSCSVFKMVLDITLNVPQGVFNQFKDTLYRNYASIRPFLNILLSCVLI